MDPTRRAMLQALAGVPAFALVNSTNAITAGGLIERAIPSTGERLPAIGVGTWQTFDVGPDAAARRALKEVLVAFAKAGGRVVDSSPMYGSSESVTGDLVAELGLAPNLFFATKVWTSGRDEGLRQMETSFSRLRVQRMDLMQVHNLVDTAVHTKTLQDWKARGRIRYLGITHYTSSAYAEVERWLRTGNYDFLQINYSLGERESAERLLPLAQEKKVAVIANRPFGEGALFSRVRGKALPEWAREIGAATWAQFFLKWIISHPAITCAIPGTGKPGHMLDNLAAGTGALPDAAMRAKMSAYFDAL
ncbi:MAG: aldo/keto reductase [Betaproteobacteria bacterium]|nr:aldo/keto reductase [Betaproteobacteria bacterium]NBX90180.1 aldo/keto reductase [Betaproteobacteria bacterium]